MFSTDQYKKSAPDAVHYCRLRMFYPNYIFFNPAVSIPHLQYLNMQIVGIVNKLSEKCILDMTQKIVYYITILVLTMTLVAISHEQKE